MLKVSALKGLVPASFTYTDEVSQQAAEINLQLRRKSFGLLENEEFQEAMNKNNLGVAIDLIVDTVAEWDLVDDDDSMIPIDASTLRALPAEFVVQTGECVIATLHPNSRRPTTSPVGSPSENQASVEPTSKTDTSS